MLPCITLLNRIEVERILFYMGISGVIFIEKKSFDNLVIQIKNSGMFI